MSLDYSWHIYRFRRGPGQGARLTIGFKRFAGFTLRQSGRWPLAAWGRDLPDADTCWKLDRELALSANTGHRTSRNLRLEAAIPGVR
jgi:hypothetical protein